MGDEKALKALGMLTQCLGQADLDAVWKEVGCQSS